MPAASIRSECEVNSGAILTFNSSNRWLGVRVELLAGSMVTLEYTRCVFFVYFRCVQALRRGKEGRDDVAWVVCGVCSLFPFAEFTHCTAAGACDTLILSHATKHNEAVDKSGKGNVASFLYLHQLFNIF